MKASDFRKWLEKISQLSWGQKEQCNGVATKYLENYLGWRRWLERWGEHNSPIIGLKAALGRENQFQLLVQT